jgi:hypothetical protein
MKKHIAVAALLLTVFVVVPLHASTFCTGTVTYLNVGNSGVITVGGPGGLPPINVCTLGQTSNGFTADSCKAVHATLLAAKLSSQNVSMAFTDNNAACSGYTQWVFATTLYSVAIVQ